MILQGSTALAGSDQHRSGLDRPGGFQITVGIPYGMNGIEMYRMPTGKLVKQAWSRLAASAVVLRPMGTEEDIRDIPADLANHAEHLVMYCCQGGQVEQPPGHTGLIGQHHHLKTTSIEVGNGFGAARYGTPLIG